MITALESQSGHFYFRCILSDRRDFVQGSLGTIRRTFFLSYVSNVYISHPA